MGFPLPQVNLMSEVLSRLQSWLLVALVFLLPLFFLPITPDFFDFNKMALLASGAVVLSVLWGTRLVAEGKFVWNRTALDIPVLLFAIVVLVSAIARTPNRMDAFVIPGSATIILAATLLFFVVTQTARHWALGTRSVVYALLASGVVVALVTLAVATGLLDGLALPNWMKVDTFSPIGAPLPALTFLLVLIPLVIGKITGASRDKLLAGLYFGIIAVILLAIVALGSQVLVNKATQVKLLPIPTGWAIAVEILKTSPLGVGPGNFLTAFGQFRPLEYNQTDVWNLRFGTSSNWYLQVFTEIGIVGLAALLFLIWQIVRLAKMENARPESGERGKWKMENYALYSILLLFLVVPANFILLTTFYLILGLFAAGASHEISTNARFATPFVFILLAANAIAFFIFGGRAYAAELSYKKALDAGAKNDVQGLINNLNSAITTNPTVDRYHISASQALFAVANAVARQKGQNATDDDRKQITGLVQDSIRQAQIAVSFNNRRSTNWENLASIYRALIPMAKDADQFAVQSYNQAIAFDPINPLLRISLGGVHFGAGRYDDAIAAFALAVQAKPDFANTHYNLAAALREKGDLQRAVTEMETVLSLVDPKSEDYKTAQKELENLKSKLPKSATGSGETLQAPQPSGSPVVKPPLTLPQEAAPPSPSPTASPNSAP